MGRRSIIPDYKPNHSNTETETATLEVDSTDRFMTVSMPQKCLTISTRDETDSAESSVSSLSLDEEIKGDASISVSPRSIFGTYWGKEGKPKRTVKPQTPVMIRRAASPMCVMEDPYHHFGLLTDEDDEDAAINSYERTLRECEIQPRKTSWASQYSSSPRWMQWFKIHKSEPLLFSHSQHLTGSRRNQSESALLQRPLKSALRQSRYSSEKSCDKHHASQNAHVKFRAKIQVRCFQPPAESWAAEGWSSYFGL